MELKGAVAVVTGGASGIGEAVAKGMALQGVKVVLGDMDLKNLERVAGEITTAGGSALFAKCNVTSDDDLTAPTDPPIHKNPPPRGARRGGAGGRGGEKVRPAQPRGGPGRGPKGRGPRRC